MNEFLNILRRVATEAVEGEKPVGVMFGEVLSTSPLQIKVEQRLTLSEDMLILTKNVTDYSVNAWSNTENFKLHIKNSLKKGEKVLLLRMQGGQRFLIIDKLKEENYDTEL